MGQQHAKPPPTPRVAPGRWGDAEVERICEVFDAHATGGRWPLGAFEAVFALGPVRSVPLDGAAPELVGFAFFAAFMHRACAREGDGGGATAQQL